MPSKKIMLLGSGELGKEFVISAKRLGLHVIAVDRYPHAPAMQVADEFEVINMLTGDELRKIVAHHKPDIIVPEVEAIRTEILAEFEKSGIFVVPTAEATNLTMNRDAIRNLASEELKLQTAKFAYATTAEELATASAQIGFPCVIKPVMSSSGKGQSVSHTPEDIENCWQLAIAGARGDTAKVIVEEFIKFEQEITLLTIKQKNGPTLFVKPIGHRQERGDYQESWLPADIPETQLKEAQQMAEKVTNRLGGAGIFGVEFFLTKDKVYFSELSPRPHDTGMVTLISQDLSEFDLHLRAIMGLPIPDIQYYQPSASHVILADRESSQAPTINGLDIALAQPGCEVRVFGKPTTRPYRRMAVALAKGQSVGQARELAQKTAESVTLDY